MDLDQNIHAQLGCGGFYFGHCPVIEGGNNDQNGISAKAARLKALPWIDHEILAQRGQGASRAGGDEIIFVPLEIGRIGQNREASGAARLVIGGVAGRVEIGTDQAF